VIKSREYPKHWWSTQSPADKADWEILPGQVKPPKVILSKRNELGLLSNLAPTPIVIEGKIFASVEALWQSCKFPENPELLPNDERATLSWPCTRAEISNLSGLEAKRLGDQASKILQENLISWVSFQGKKMSYPEVQKGPFFELIYKAMLIKLETHSDVKKVLLATGDLVLMPDHIQIGKLSPAHFYHEIWMQIRTQIQTKHAGPK
jgi:predicted NAD-dependent protein-ADP-ribosyltransferase YbiA (DUF1768 family)